jgi:uncharacterized membrane protein
MAYVAWLIYQTLCKTTKKPLFAESLAGVAGTIVMALGYFIYEAWLFVSVSVAWLNIGWNVLQGVVGTIIAVAVMRILQKTKLLSFLDSNKK